MREALSRAGLEITAASAVRETEPFGYAEQPLFLNQVIAGTWPDTPRELLAAAKAAEAQVGRTSGERWGPRVADADIVLFGARIVDEPDLHIPHLGLPERRFVLEPLAELAPDLEDPRSGRRIADLLADILGS